MSIIVRNVFNKKKEEVWKAISEKDQMILWFFENIPAFDANVGFRTEFIVQLEERKFTHQWEIHQVIPFKKLVLSWKYKEYPGEGKVTFELIEKEVTTELILTFDGLETFPQNVPEFTEESCAKGWNYFICQKLAEYLK